MTQKAKNLEQALTSKDQEREKLEQELQNESKARSESEKELQAQLLDLRDDLHKETEEKKALQGRNAELEEEVAALIEILEAEKAEATARLSRLGQHLERPRLRNF